MTDHANIPVWNLSVSEVVEGAEFPVCTLKGMKKPSLYSLAVAASTFSVIASDRWLWQSRQSFFHAINAVYEYYFNWWQLYSFIMKCNSNSSPDILFCRQIDDIPGRIHKWHVPQTSSESFPLDSRVLFRLVPISSRMCNVESTRLSSCACDC